MKYADKLGARWSVVIGDDELANGKITLKNMQTKETVECVPQADAICKAIGIDA